MAIASLSSFTDEIQQLTYDLVRYYEICDQVCVKELDVTASQGYILLALPDVDSITMNELSDKVRLANSTMTRMMDQLVQKGMAAREPDPADRRIVRVRLTEKGRGTGTRLKQALHEVFSEVLRDLPEGEKHDLLHSLKTLNQSIVKTLKDCCGVDLSS